MNKENKTVSVVPGALNVPNSNGRIYGTDNTNSPIKFGIRAIVRPSDNKGATFEVDQIICFDVINNS